MKKSIPALLLGAFALLGNAYAHVHGEAQLEILQEGEQLTLNLHSPLDGLVGFERAPRTAAEKETARKAKEKLTQGEAVFAFSAAAQCRLQDVSINAPVLDGQAAQKGHADLSASYRFQCAQASALREINTRLFKEFPRLHKIKAAYVGPNGQHGATLTRSKPALAW